MRATIVMLMLVACGDDSPVEEAVVPQPVVTGETMQIDEDPCEQPGSWDHTGQPFMLTWCTGCHAGGRVGEERHGAPDGVDFDTLSDVQAWETRILARVEDGTMPPGGGPPDAQRARLAHWFACGSPGETSSIEGVRDSVSPAAAATVITSTTTSTSFEGATAWVLREGDYLSGVGGVTRVIETWEVAGSDAWLWSRDLRDETGTTLQSWSWDPPLPVGRGDTDVWSAEVTQRVEFASGETTSAEQIWEFIRLPATDVDGWSIETAPTRVLGLSDGGEEEGWELSSEYGVTARWWLDADGAGLVYQQALEQSPGSFEDGFPLGTIDRRGGRIVEWEVTP